jgi:hypothetical protein
MMLFYFKKIMFEISTLKQSKNIKNKKNLAKKMKFKGTWFQPHF